MYDDTKVMSKLLAFGMAGVAVFYATMLLWQMSNGSLPVHYWPAAVPFAYISQFVIIPILMFLATRYPQAKLPALIWFHFSGIVVQTWFTEVYSPFTVVWCMYILISFIYYDWKGFIASAGALVFQASWYVIAFRDSHQPNFQVYAMLATLVVTITICTAYLFARVIGIGKQKNIDLAIARKHEQERANQLNILLNSIREPVLTASVDGVVTSHNSAASLFFNSSSIIGKNINDVLPIKSKAGQQITTTDLFALFQQTITRDDLIFTGSPVLRYVELQLTRIVSTSSATDGWILVMIRDITKQKTLEEEKDEFISVTSHELRTPIAIIEGGLGNIEVLRSKKIDDQRIDEAISAARSQILSLSQIVNDISTISRAEKGDGDTESEINITEMLIEIQKKYKDEAENKSLVLRLEVAENIPLAYTSRVYLSEILQNFVKNGIKYTKVGGITLKAGLLDDGRIYFDIIDTGIGISDTDKPRIFEKFYRSEDFRTRETGGTGLGLYEAKMLATRIDAYIQVASAIDRGSVFRLTLPTSAVRLNSRPAAVVGVPQEA